MSWYYTSAGVQLGPVPEETLRSLAASGRLLASDMVWKEGMPAWQPAGSVPGLLPAAPGGPPPFQQPYAVAPPLPPRIAPAGEDPALRWVLPVGRSGWAIASGYLGIFSLLGIFAPFAVITGFLALREIKKNPKLGGRGRAVFGIVMGSVVTLGAAFAILIPMLSK
jgi:hypothetical protein